MEIEGIRIGVCISRVYILVVTNTSISPNLRLFKCQSSKQKPNQPVFPHTSLQRTRLEDPNKHCMRC